tara:strand:+ start:297 stop:617 length:321 start_codon:yes stop_codon:yes gene_type:complete
VKSSYKEGDLVKITREKNCTLCHLGRSPRLLQEMPVKELQTYSNPRTKKVFESFEGKVGLIVYAVRNRLEQVMGYRVLIEGTEMFCKSTVAEKYFKLVENQGDESG